MKEFTKIFTEVYKNVATVGEYSMEKANQIGYGNGVKAIDMPKTMSDELERIGGGCCFHYSWKMIYELNKVGIKSYWAMIPEPTKERPRDLKCVVVYETPEGNRWVADIIEEVKAKVKLEDYVGDTCKRITATGEIVDNSKIALEQMVRDSVNPITPGFLRIYPIATDSQQSFLDYNQNSEYEQIDA